jgi:hypothetical protein
VGKLPGWAKTKIIASSSPPAATAAAAANGQSAKSRWAGVGAPAPRPYDNIIVEDDSSPKEGSSLEWSARTPSSMSEMGSMSPHPAAQIRHVASKSCDACFGELYSAFSMLKCVEL